MVAAQELYSRDLVYHKVKKTWYKREKGITNYAYISVKEEFSTVSWSFVQCNETIKSTDLLSAAELNEYVKMLNQCIVCLQTYFMIAARSQYTHIPLLSNIHYGNNELPLHGMFLVIRKEKEKNLE